MSMTVADAGEAAVTASRRRGANGDATSVGREDRVAVVMITRNRRDSTLASLGHLLSLPEAPRIVIVDNGSSDGTAAAIREAYPQVEMIALAENLGSAGRTIGARRVDAPYIAFADDDSWWAPASLRRAADLLDQHPRLALVAARVLVGAEEQPDPTCAAMAESPRAGEAWLPGPPVLGFIACGAVVRRDAYLRAGGFHRSFGVGGEEELLAIDLAAAGWRLAYVDTVVAYHHPSPVRDRAGRRRTVTRNALWCAWLRRSPGDVAAITARTLRDSLRDEPARRGLLDAARGLPWVLRERYRLSDRVEADLRRLERGRPEGQAPDPSVPESAAPQPATLDVSVVIPTYRRDDTLLRCLEALAGQDFPRNRFEVIVVDDARSDTVPGVVAGVAARYPDLRIRSLPGESRGPAAARNIGWRAATGAIIAFIDDDAYPADDQWLTRGCASFADPRVMAVSGRVRVPAGDPPTDFQRNVQGLERGEFVTCNAFYRRAALEHVGGFDEAFTMPFREDSDLQYRVEDLGGRLVHNPDAVVIHPAPPGRFAISLRLQRYSQFNALIYKKHPRRYRRLLERRPPLHYYGMIGAALTGIAAFLAGRRGIAGLSLLIWSALEGRFFLRRARRTSHRPRHLLDLALTSLVIPWLSVYWRLRGAARHRVFFF